MSSSSAKNKGLGGELLLDCSVGCPAEKKSTPQVAVVLEREAPAALLFWNVELAEGIGGKTCEEDS